MPTNFSALLNAPIDPSTPEAKAFLGNLQGNILAGHGRDHATLLFLRFKDTKTAEAKSWLKAFAKSHITTAAQQQNEIDTFKQTGIGGKSFASVLLTAKGYKSLGLGDFTPKQDGEPFAAGMVARGSSLNDPTTSAWDAGYQEDIHALVLLADAESATLQSLVAAVSKAVIEFADITAREEGQSLYNADKLHIEHFGFVDGLSDPQFFTTRIEAQKRENGGTDKWNPGAPPKLVLVPDPSGPDGASYGSYLVFRKLEQNVRGFHEKEEELAKALGTDRETAGAMLVGRFRDGTPLVNELPSNERARHVFNNFTFADDQNGSKCPFHAHIRKTNPRFDTVTRFGVPKEDELDHRIVRRAIPYGPMSTSKETAVLPSDRVGLLFMCFQASLENQFEFMQASWANAQGFVAGGTGVDPLIGQTGEAPNAQHFRAKDGSSKAFDFSRFVTLKGGEYFFAPSMFLFEKL